MLNNSSRKEGIFMKLLYTKLLVILFAIVTFISVTSESAFAEGEVDWSRNVVRATAIGIAPPNAVNQAQAVAMAKVAARAIAQRDLLATIKGININSETTVENMIATSDIIRTQVNGVLVGAVEVAGREISGGYEVTMEVPLFGTGNSIAKAVIPQPQTIETFPTPTVSIPSSGGYTGLIVDCRGLGLKPVMSPVIKSDSGQSIYGYKNLDYDKVISQGMANYSYNINSGVERAGSNPLIVKAVSLEGVYRGNPVVSASDANRILAENSVSHFLESTNVVFIR